MGKTSIKEDQKKMKKKIPNKIYCSTGKKKII